MSADLAAERTLAAEKGKERIVVEIKSFLGPSLHHDLQQALGQFEIYRIFLNLTEPDRILFLAISKDIYTDFFGRKSVQTVMQATQLKLVVVNLETEEVTQWIH